MGNNQQPTPEEIIKALHILQDTCNFYGMSGYKCEKCPLAENPISETHTCIICDFAPSDWSIGDAPDKTWRAFNG